MGDPACYPDSMPKSADGTEKPAPRAFRLTPEADKLLTTMAEYHGIPLTAVVEMAIREKAERDGFLTRKPLASEE